MIDVAEQVLAAVNARDLDAFVGCYAPDATIENGYDEIRAPDVGDFVVQEETVTGRSGRGSHVAVYLIQGGLIARERLIA